MDTNESTDPNETDIKMEVANLMAASAALGQACLDYRHKYVDQHVAMIERAVTTMQLVLSNISLRTTGGRPPLKVVK